MSSIGKNTQLQFYSSALHLAVAGTHVHPTGACSASSVFDSELCIDLHVHLLKSINWMENIHIGLWSFLI